MRVFPRSGQSNPLAERPPFIELCVKWLFIGTMTFAVIYPLAYVVSTSLASQQDVTESGDFVLFPRHGTFAAYEQLIAGGLVTRAISVSVGITIVGTLVSLCATVALAYSLSRPVVGRRALLWIVLFTLVFSPGIIPSYLIVKQLGLLNTYASLILPVLVNAFNLVIMRQFFLGIPQDLLESARMDGASELSVLIRIVLPLSGAVVAVVALFYAVAYWNSFFSALLYLNDTTMWPLQLVVREYVLQGATPDINPGAPGAPPWQATRMAVVVLAVIPILLVYPFLQRYFTKGVLTGAIKG
jgi:putative aldouronate transport system permease protein